jgi:arylsulfatase A-like enzyme
MYAPLFPAGTRADAPVSLVDLFPTILEIAGVEESATPDYARKLVAGPDSGQEPERIILSEYGRPTTLVRKYWQSRYPGRDFSGYERALRAVRKGRYKYITTDQGEDYLYDLAVDTTESHDLSDSLPAVIGEMREAGQGFE